MVEITLKPIGFVRNNVKAPRFGSFADEVSEIIACRLDGTPVIDIKPYWPQYDRVEGGKIPEWVNKLEF